MSTITTIAGSDNISTSDTVINTNFTNLNTDKIETSYLDTDTSLAANSDVKIATQKAVKTYIDTSGGANASTTVRGIMEVSTQAEFDAGTALGATGASLAITPALIKGSLNPIVRTYLNAGSPATWTKPSGLKYVIVEVQAGGGGSNGTTTADEVTSGGASGGYCKKLIAAASLGATETVTIGAGGAAGAGGGGAGGTGGTSSFGSHCSAVGGGGGGTATGGDININGFNGGAGDNSGTTRITGAGANSLFGIGGYSKLRANTTGNTTGTDGQGYGSGAGGANCDDGADTAGGAGAAGIVIVTEYYS